MQLSITRLRERLPPATFVLLLALLLLCVGLAYACTNTHPGQAVEQVVSTAQPAALVELWSLIVLGLLVGAVYGLRRRPPANARSPALPQRLLL